MVTMAMTAITYDGDGDAGQPLIRMVPLMMVIMVMMALMMVMMIVIVIVIMVMIIVLPITLLPALYNSTMVPHPLLQQRTIRIIQCYRSAQDSNGRPQRLSRLLHPRLYHNR